MRDLWEQAHNTWLTVHKQKLFLCFQCPLNDFSTCSEAKFCHGADSIGCGQRKTILHGSQLLGFTLNITILATVFAKPSVFLHAFTQYFFFLMSATYKCDKIYLSIMGYKVQHCYFTMIVKVAFKKVYGLHLSMHFYCWPCEFGSKFYQSCFNRKSANQVSEYKKLQDPQVVLNE